MKKISILLIVTVAFLTSCGPSEQEVEIENQRIKKMNEEEMIRKSDSSLKVNLTSTWGVNYKFRIDSTNKVNQKKIEKEAKKEAEKKELAMKNKYGKAWTLCEKHPGWSLDDCVKLLKGRVWIGMKYEMLVYIRGKPNSVNTSNYGNGNQYQCCWDDYNPSCFYMGSDDIITAYN